MKKTILLIALLVSQVIVSVAAELNLNTILNGAGEGVEVSFYEITYNPATMDSSLTVLCTSSTNLAGEASCSGNTQESAGYIGVLFTNCYGELVNSSFYYDANLETTYSTSFDYCPEEPTVCIIYLTIDSTATTAFNVVLELAVEGTPISYFWDFGDGSSSTAMLPSHTYATTGEYNVCLSIITEEGCIMTGCILINIDGGGLLGGGGAQQAFTLNVVQGQLVSVEDEDANSELIVYPNPTVDLARVAISSEFADKAQVCLYNMAGQIVMQETLVVGGNQAFIDLDLSGQNAGFYMVKVVFENGTSVSRSLIKK
ncbi:MAG: hypothetical protein RL204_192 [Bacteroidota bacterium]|jgi:hypothetical protein